MHRTRFQERMSMQNSTVKKFAIVGCLGLLLVARAAQVTVQLGEAQKPLGHFTRDEIMKRSEPIAEAVSPRTKSLSFSACPMIALTKEGRRRPIWMAECVAPTGNYQVHMEWDAQSGELLSLCHTRPLTPCRKRPISYSSAARIAGSWLSTLGISKKDIGWRAAQDADYEGDVWHVLWYAPRHRIEVAIDARSGDLIQLRSTNPRRSQHPMAVQTFPSNVSNL